MDNSKDWNSDSIENGCNIKILKGSETVGNASKAPNLNESYDDEMKEFKKNCDQILEM